MNILILGGTGEARELATRLVALGHKVTTSLAGRTTAPLAPPGAIRTGGFGGASGLAEYLTTHAIDHLVDATHPYAANISANAVLATNTTGTPLLRFSRPQWHGDWLETPDFSAAATLFPANARVLVTSGHAGLENLLTRADCTFLIRLIEPPAAPLPANAHLLLDRPPYDLAAETRLMRENAITHLISKNSGGAQTAAKLEAARGLGIPIIMIARPRKPPAPEVSSVAAALHELGPRR